MDVSPLFVTLMGMGVTFFGLICVIFLTWLLGRIMTRLAAPKEPEPAAAAAAPAASAASAADADGLTDEVRIAILAALAQEPGLRLENAVVRIRRV